jgi:pimeloyl-ACP methyl ester carboxylesterase
MIDDGKFFDIISWDPRSINHTQPQLDCFPDSFQRLMWTVQAETEGLIGTSDTAFDRKWARYQSRSEACMQRVAEAGENSIAYHMGTTSAVRDMVEIAERHGKWREAQAESWLMNQARFRGETSHSNRYDPNAVRERTKWKPGNEMILYWGFSYGTVIGASLAAMYPNRIERIVLDSVLTPESYFSGHWLESLQDTDKVMDEFAKYCHRYGPGSCPFFRDSGTKTILQEYHDLLVELQNTPLPVPGSTTRGPDVITRSDVEVLVRTSVYHPIDKFPRMATLLQDVSQKDGTTFADYKANLRSTTFSDIATGAYSLTPNCKVAGPYSPPCQMPNEWHDENQAGVYCSDGPSMHNVTKKEFKKYWKQLRTQSKVMGSYWAEYHLMCVSWTAQAKWKYTGKFSYDSEQQRSGQLK